jgi:hypothetical protein
MPALPIAVTITPTGNGAQPIYVHGWSGYIPDLAEVVDADRRPGQDGMVAQGTGAVHDPVDCTAQRFFKSKADAIAFAATVRTLQSPTPLKMVDVWGRTIRVRFHRASANLLRVSGPVDGTTQSTYLVTCNFSVERFPDASATP